MIASDLLLGAAILVIERRYPVENLSTGDLSASLSGADPPLLLDVRTEAEYRKSRIATAIRIDPDCSAESFEERYGRQLAGRDVVAYCSVGQRSSELLVRVGRVCAQSGAKRCRNLSGGIFRWYNEGRPVVDDSGVTDEIDGFDPVWGMMVERRA